MDEAEVEHLVGFVEDEDFERRDRSSGALVDEVEQTAGRGDEDVDDRWLSCADLLADRHAAEDRRRR